MSITCLFKCSCMKDEGSFQVPDRRADEDVGDWMRGCVEPALYLAHRDRSPLCIAMATEYVKIPVPENAPFIGASPKLDA